MIFAVPVAAAATAVEGGGDGDRGPAVVAATTGAARDVLLGSEYVGFALSPAGARGPGPVGELGVAAFPGFSPAAGADIVPAMPFLAAGVAVGREALRGAGGVHGVFVPPNGADLGVALGGSVGVAVRGGGRSVGFEAGAGYARLLGHLFDAPATDPLWGRLGQSQVERDFVEALRGTVETVLAWDVDGSSVLFARLGGSGGSAVLDSPALKVRWEWTGIEPRATVGAAWRPSPGVTGSMALRAGRREPGAAVPWPWTAAISLTVDGAPRSGAAVAAPPADLPAPAPAPVFVPRIPATPHPELDCPDGAVPTGAPPPLGLEGWCEVLHEAGRVVREGAYVRWHDPEHVAERGTYADDERTGVWSEFSIDGTRVAEGAYVDGLREGPWRSWYPSGVVETDQDWLRGREEGVWRYYGEDGALRVVGAWLHGARDGSWVEYAADGRPVRERVYRDGRLLYTQER